MVRELHLYESTYSLITGGDRGVGSNLPVGVERYIANWFPIWITRYPLTIFQLLPPLLVASPLKPQTRPWHMSSGRRQMPGGLGLSSYLVIVSTLTGIDIE